jgi:hypothetical protein
MQTHILFKKLKTGKEKLPTIQDKHSTVCHKILAEEHLCRSLSTLLGFLGTNTSETEAVLWDPVLPVLDMNKNQSQRTLLHEGRVQFPSASHFTQNVFKLGAGRNSNISGPHMPRTSKATQLHMPSTQSTHQYSQGLTTISSVPRTTVSSVCQDGQASALFARSAMSGIHKDGQLSTLFTTDNHQQHLQGQS